MLVFLIILFSLLAINLALFLFSRNKNENIDAEKYEVK